MKYGSGVIREFGGRLYRKADWLTLRYTAGGALVALAGGLLWPAVAQSRGVRLPETTELGGFLLRLCIGALLGYQLGREKAFALGLQAQTALVQVEIEENTLNAARILVQIERSTRMREDLSARS